MNTVPVLVWAAGYGVLRLWWAVAGAPEAARADLGAFSGWPAVALCALTAALAYIQPRSRTRLPTVAGWLLAAVLAVAPYRIVLDLFGLVLPGAGMRFAVLPFLSRLACLGGAVLLGLSTVAYARRRRPGHRPCGPVVEPPRWAPVSAYAVIGAFVLRAAWQLGFEPDTPDSVTFADDPVTGSVTMIPFAAAGILLPLALAHRFGRVYPRWVPFLAGRSVPRLLVLVPAVGAALLILAYFASGTASLAATALGATAGDAAEAARILGSTWVADLAYVVWGLGLVGAALGYHRMTRRPCRECADAESPGGGTGRGNAVVTA